MALIKPLTNFAEEFNPVPTAVPPWAKKNNSSLALFILFKLFSICLAKALNSCSKVIGVASCKWVLPIFTIFLNSLSFFLIDWMNFKTCGSRVSVIIFTNEICMAVGNESLEDCPKLQWSFGCIGSYEPSFFPRFLLALLAITSFKFIFVCVPEPVCHTDKGNWSFNFPEIISSHTFIICFPNLELKLPRATLLIVAAFFWIAKANISSFGILSKPISKFSRLLCVWAPQYLSSGTLTLPKVSFSILKFFIYFFLKSSKVTIFSSLFFIFLFFFCLLSIFLFSFLSSSWILNLTKGS